MTTNIARTGKKRLRKTEILRIATWNISSWASRDQEIIEELKKHKIDICAINETKKKGKGNTRYDEYILFYSGKQNYERATAGVGLLINKKYCNNITNTEYIDERILKVTMLLDKQKLNIISIYAPDAGKPQEETIMFYEKLEEIYTKIPKNEKTIILGDFNGRIGNDYIAGVKQRFNENTINDNGEALINFCIQNELRINNTFYQHREQYKVTWRNTRGHTSMIDYIITSKTIHPTTIIDVRTLTSANIGSDHGLVLSKIRLAIVSHRQKPCYIEKFNIESFNDDSTKTLYRNRLEEKINHNKIEEDNSIEKMWKKVKDNIVKAAEEAIGKRKVNVNKNNKTPWFTKEVKQLADKKRKAYLAYKTKANEQEFQKYKRIRNEVNAEIKQIKKAHWERFTKEMENDLYGGQKKIWKMIQNKRKDLKENFQTNKISEKEWKDYFTTLYGRNSQSQERILEPQNHGGNIEQIKITVTEIQDALKIIKNRKAPGPDGIPNELLKYGSEKLAKELKKLFNKILASGIVPQEWKESITIPIFKKGSKAQPHNYRGITLLNSCVKLFTRLLQHKLENNLAMHEEQQGFRKNRGTLDAIFITRQIAEKAMEYNTPAYMCFVDLTKAFDRIQLEDVLNILSEEDAPSQIIAVIRDLNTNNTTQIKSNNVTTGKIDISSGIRQGDSLSPMLFNLVMNKIINDIRTKPGYKMGKHNINIVCYADDALLIADEEDKLQRLLQQFDQTAKKYNMNVAIEKTKSLVIAKQPTRCKLELNNKIIEQVGQFQYLGVQIGSYRDVIRETRNQCIKTQQISGCLRDIIWNNKYLNIESKVKVYKTAVRPVMTYAIETRAETKKTKQMVRTTEMKILRSILGITLRQRIRNTEIRNRCNIEDVVKWARKRRKGWNDHITRMEGTRIVKICRDNKPPGRRQPGRPQQRWLQSWVSSSTESPPNP